MPHTRHSWLRASMESSVAIAPRMACCFAAGCGCALARQKQSKRSALPGSSSRKCMDSDITKSYPGWRFDPAADFSRVTRRMESKMILRLRDS